MGVGKCQERQNTENIHAWFLPFSSSHRRQGFCWRQGSRDSVASEWESEKEGQGGSGPRPSPRTNDQQQETHWVWSPQIWMALNHVAKHSSMRREGPALCRPAECIWSALYLKMDLICLEQLWLPGRIWSLILQVSFLHRLQQSGLGILG